MQKYSDGLTYLNTAIGVAYNWAVPYSQMPDTQTYYLIHSQQYLVYKSTGRIVDITGTNDDISLDDGDTYNSYDLDTIDWLAYGDLYRVVGCSVCMEDEVGV